ncbi:MAG: hypothetical protein L0I76_31000 [Pseudonocardia sp.]|nr:hypothetical protein [Pseudonocardia sp.]
MRARICPACASGAGVVAPRRRRLATCPRCYVVWEDGPWWFQVWDGARRVVDSFGRHLRPRQ